jgi:hypothetical protein
MTNFESIKYNISNMSVDEFIEYCGGDSCINILCKEISGQYIRCMNTGRAAGCGECIKEYLEAEIE